MASVTGEDWRNVMNLTAMSDENAEYILDLAIDTLNALGTSLDNMAGVTPKTVTLTSKERGGVFIAARAIYYGFFKGIETVGVAGLAVTSSDLMSDPATLKLLVTIAGRVEAAGEIAFVVGEDTTGYD